MISQFSYAQRAILNFFRYFRSIIVNLIFTGETWTCTLVDYIRVLVVKQQFHIIFKLPNARVEVPLLPPYQKQSKHHPLATKRHQQSLTAIDYNTFFFLPFVFPTFSSLLTFLPDLPQSEQDTSSSEPPVFLFSLASPRQKSQYGLGIALSFPGWDTVGSTDTAATGTGSIPFSATNTGIGGSSVAGGGWFGRFGGNVGGTWDGIVGCGTPGFVRLRRPGVPIIRVCFVLSNKTQASWDNWTEVFFCLALAFFGC